MSGFLSAEQLAPKIAIIKTLSPIRQRAVGAIVGSAVGDAATRPFHWVYDRKLLESTTEGKVDVEFWPESISPFYTLPTGRRSCYNDLMLMGLRALPDVSRGDESSFFSTTNVIKETKSMFSPESEYAIAFARRKEAYDPAKRLEKREPVPGPWQQGAVTYFLESLEKDDGSPRGNPELKESDGFCTALPLIARLCALSTEIPPTTRDKLVRQASALFSPHEVSVAHSLAAAHLLHRIINNPTRNRLQVAEANDVIINLHRLQQEEEATTSDEKIYAYLDLSVLQDELGAVAAAISENHVDAVERFGKACAHPGSFMGALLAVLQCGDDYKSVVRHVIRAGGCNCSRVNLAGALAGALHGIDSEGDGKGIPLDWMEKTDGIEEILTLAIKAVTTGSD